jgi:hypothetical protein
VAVQKKSAAIPANNFFIVMLFIFLPLHNVDKLNPAQVVKPLTDTPGNNPANQLVLGEALDLLKNNHLGYI